MATLCGYVRFLFAIHQSVRVGKKLQAETNTSVPGRQSQNMIALRRSIFRLSA